jgi:transcriptional regulator with XRE-family HTH domain
MHAWQTLALQGPKVFSVPPEPLIERELALAFGRHLRDLRDAAGLTQEKAAERAGMSRNHYQLLESGLSDRARKSPANPRLSTLLDIAHALDCDPTRLVEGLAR